MKKFLKFLLMFVLVFVGFCLLVAFAFYRMNENALGAMNTSAESVSNKIDTDQPFSILLLGADTGADGRTDRGNSDTIMLVTVNPHKDKVSICSIPRDTMAEIADQKSPNVQKINAAYNIGTSPVAKDTVSNLLNVPVDYTVAINMEALEKTVNFVGGIDVNSNMKVSYDGITVPKGKSHLNGIEALTYSRMRYQDPNGDYGRQLRQQQILEQIVGKLKQPQYLFRMPQLLKSLGPDVNTDLTSTQIAEIPIRYHSTDKNVSSEQMKEKTAWINGSSYQVASTSVLQNTSNKLRTSLNLPKANLDNTETKLNLMNSDFFSEPNNTNYNTDGLDLTYYSDNTY
ncbi:LCP family protein [Companilactobacillus mishanensis]|uniref:LCP family protein n=1 Tax=Companilactobacillus mishanensis TaxID=2486008 RepID=UPI001EE98F7F|nr:LCP family protein [Companilactobacillus mishanensis]